MQRIRTFPVYKVIIKDNVSFIHMHLLFRTWDIEQLIEYASFLAVKHVDVRGMHFKSREAEYAYEQVWKELDRREANRDIAFLEDIGILRRKTGEVVYLDNYRK